MRLNSYGSPGTLRAGQVAAIVTLSHDPITLPDWIEEEAEGDE